MTQRSTNLSRADQVRARRKIEPVHKKPIPQSSRNPSRNAENSARVVARQEPFATPRKTIPQNQTKHKRKVYVPTSTPGSEIQLPTLPSIKFGWRIVSGMLVLILSFALFLIQTSDIFKIQSVTLNGAQRVSTTEITDAIGLLGESIIEAVPAEIETKVRNNYPEIKTVHASISLPAQLNLTVEERIPAIKWVVDGQNSFWIDEEGYSFPIRGEATIPMIVQAENEPPRPLGYLEPEITTETDNTGVTNSDLSSDDVISSLASPSVEPTFVSAVLKLRAVIPQNTALLYNKENGLGWLDPHGWQVFFGTDANHIDMKLLEYEKIVQSMLDKNLQPVLISLEYLHAPYYRLE